MLKNLKPKKSRGGQGSQEVNVKKRKVTRRKSSGRVDRTGRGSYQWQAEKLMEPSGKVGSEGSPRGGGDVENNGQGGRP